jgi:hypothetical protein
VRDPHKCDAHEADAHDERNEQPATRFGACHVGVRFPGL